MSKALQIEMQIDTSKMENAFERVRQAFIDVEHAEFQRAVENLSLVALRSAQTFKRYGDAVSVLEATIRQAEQKWRARRCFVTFKLNMILLVVIVFLAAVCK